MEYDSHRKHETDSPGLTLAIVEKLAGGTFRLCCGICTKSFPKETETKSIPALAVYVCEDCGAVNTVTNPPL